ncbi:MAG: AbrB/MazE/SpoVT family DNA-binding domain-containing protein [Akkermansiaceae bacterium]|nr:AbrB/MazE/SpoVT family DNA-binding domain-containing protein [Akkermansiaceae bacterium]
MKMNQHGQITIPKVLREKFGLVPDSTLIVETSKDGILIKPMPSHLEQVSQCVKDEHGNEMASLTTDQIMRLVRD